MHVQEPHLLGLSKEAKKDVSVLLSGEAADEIFGGYPSLNRSIKYNQYKRLAIFNKFLPAYLSNSYPNKKFDFLDKKINFSEYLLYRGLFTPKDVAKILNINTKEVWTEIRKLNYQEDVTKLTAQNRATYFETAIYMQNQLLKDSDSQSMWHSVELRVPFLDKDLMDFVNNLKPEIKFSKQKIKTLLVDSYIKELPKLIWDRPKQGFTFPFENWFKTMKVFENNKLVPNWALSMFISKKLNFSRLWAIFLTYGVDLLSNTKTID